MKKSEKLELGQEYQKQVGNAAAMILTEYRGLTVEKMSKLRDELRKASAEYRVVKNRVFAKSLEGAGIAGLKKYLKGPTAIAFHATDPVATAKILVDFAKENENLTVKAAVVDGHILDGSSVAALSKLPGKKEIQSAIVGQVNALLGVVTFSIDGILSEIAGLVEAREKSLQSEAA